ncbi:MAG TPA: DUF3168 domain-containing protein [Thermaerobacter sp.]
MGAITKAIYDRLAGDDTLRSMLATYEGQPAIFTAPPPGKSPYPMIVTTGNATDSPDDTKTSRGREIWRDITCYTEATGSMADVEAIAERVRQLFHRAKIPVDGYQVWLSEASGPIPAETDQTVYGLVVTVRLRMQEVQ